MLQPLLSNAPENPWFLDMMTDIDLGQNRAAQAINRLQNAPGAQANPVLQLNLANAYVEGSSLLLPAKYSIAIPTLTLTTRTAGICWHKPQQHKDSARKNWQHAQRVWRSAASSIKLFGY